MGQLLQSSIVTIDIMVPDVYAVFIFSKRSQKWLYRYYIGCTYKITLGNDIDKRFELQVRRKRRLFENESRDEVKIP